MRAAFDIFHPLDGQFAPNVVVQIKYGPIDFQAEEPASPALRGPAQNKRKRWSCAESRRKYLGQQRHLVYLAPLWKEKLDFDLRGENRSTPVKEIIEGKSFNQPLGRHDWRLLRRLTRRMAWAPPMAMAKPLRIRSARVETRIFQPKQIAAEWTKANHQHQTMKWLRPSTKCFSEVVANLRPLHRIHLGTQTLTDITGSHYGPNIEASERNGWGQWHRDDPEGIGMDRSVATGTGFAGQYPPEVAKMYESAATTPDSLLLFFHHMPWTYKLHSGKTIIQYVYDIHYQGATEAAQLGDEWATLKGKIDPQLFEDERARLEISGRSRHRLAADAIVRSTF